MSLVIKDKASIDIDTFHVLHFHICFRTAFLMVIFTVALAKVQLPFPSWSKKRGFHFVKVQVFRIFSVSINWYGQLEKMW